MYSVFCTFTCNSLILVAIQASFVLLGYCLQCCKSGIQANIAPGRPSNIRAVPGSGFVNPSGAGFDDTKPAVAVAVPEAGFVVFSDRRITHESQSQRKHKS